MPKRETMHISLPPDLREYVREVIEREGFASESEYVRSLVREDRRQRARNDLDDALLEGLRSGEFRVLNDEVWREIRQRAEQRAKRQDDAAA